MNITVDKKDAVLAAAIDAERYPACHMRYDAPKPFDIPYPETMHVLRELAQMGYISKPEPYGKKCISKLTQDLILSSNGVGFVLRNFSLKLILQRYATKRTSLRRNSHHLSLNE